MALKRKPPRGNIRRVAPIDTNLRYSITSKADETVQCESFQERKLTLLFDRDPTIQEYRSQPLQFTFTDTQHKTRPNSDAKTNWSAVLSKLSKNSCHKGRKSPSPG
ncbi:hypothetical protein EPA93_10050 [Ktedonosporobacter rubrisoli]|uniref:Uncharacterized protein n=1 Tax=Ktedonosporobacter rubrisoli TaxID=2509675 RepID=A0A4P6JMP3_KTERU|nr:hypothetical protein [Ktedonosporobacter rubrisoli]QBD76330.1 hypothetical protein EPA93_10050 [Ktedonosporobacter rubrisoli]